jgi:alkylation response protein AidB-like acyl-CoA dehydrogenase
VDLRRRNQHGELRGRAALVHQHRDHLQRARPLSAAKEEAIAIARELEGCPREERFDRFFARIRDSRIPYLACRPDPDPEALYYETFDALFILGATSLPLAIGLTMHQYVLSALATFPLREPSLRRQTERLLREIEERRLLLAIGSVGPANVTIEESEGRAYAKGRTAFQSMASQADLLGFIGTHACGAVGFYVIEMKQEEVRVGERIFSGAMAEADTRSVELAGVPLADRHLMTRDDDLTRLTMFYGTAWFEALISAAYLGAAARALDAARAFACSVSLPDGTTLAELDGTRMEFGRMAIGLDAALAQVPCVGRSLRTFDRAVEAASIAKYTSTRAAEDLVQQVRRFIGTRAMSPGSIVEELSQQITFGPLHPKVSAIFERDLGRRVLGLGSIVHRTGVR